MPKNIVICCDGTNNEFKSSISNVVKLYQSLDLSQPDQQIAFYDPGVGTLDMKYWGLILGAGITQNIKDAYLYLMNYYEEGDRIYLFGYSRGAYTVRLLGGLISMCGLLKRGNDNLIDYAIQKIYYKNDKDVAPTFKKTFSYQECHTYFIGVWDTVKALNPFSAKFHDNIPNSKVKFCYHALALDERRRPFTPKLWDETNKPDDQIIEQVWFAGVHADIGGSHKEAGLSNITLYWMIDKATQNGLLVTRNCEDDIQDMAEERVKWDTETAIRESVAKYGETVSKSITDYGDTVAKSVEQYGAYGAKLSPKIPLFAKTIGDVLSIHTDVQASEQLLHNSSKGWWPLLRDRKLPHGAKIHNTVFERMLLAKGAAKAEQGIVKTLADRLRSSEGTYYIPRARATKQIAVSEKYNIDHFFSQISSRKKTEQWLENVALIREDF